MMRLAMSMFLVLLAAGSPTEEILGVVVGQVRDYALSDEEKSVGVAGVDVTLTSGGDQQVITDADGFYTLQKVKMGDVQVQYKREGYKPRPRIDDFQLSAATQSKNVWLLREDGDEEYYATAGRKVISQGAKSGQGKTGFVEQWKIIEDMGLSEEQKQIITRELQEELGPKATQDIQDAARGISGTNQMPPAETQALLHYYDGISSGLSGDTQKAKQDLEQSLNLSGDAAFTLYQLGKVYKQESALEDAQSMFEKAVELQPGNAKFSTALEEVRADQRAMTPGEHP